MANENEQGFAISCPDGLWVTGIVEAGGKWRWVLGIEEERGICPTRMTACLRYYQGYRIVELEEGDMDITGYKWTCSKCGKVKHTSRKGGKQDAPAPLPKSWTQRVKLLYYETLCPKCQK